MKYFVTIITTVVLFTAGCGNGQVTPPGSLLSPTEFSEKIKELPNSPLIDVRTPEEYSKGHLPNSINIDWNGEHFIEEISKLDKSKPVLVYCLSGGRSSMAAAKMRAEGFTLVYELKGGIIKWRAENLPETTDKTMKSTGMSATQYDSLTTSNPVVLIDFYADWCGPCVKMKPYLDEISITMADQVKVIRINADDNQQLCKDLKIDALPVLNLYKNDSLTWSQSGYCSKEEVLKHLN